jgi:hypothetical protein
VSSFCLLLPRTESPDFFARYIPVAIGMRIGAWRDGQWAGTETWVKYGGLVIQSLNMTGIPRAGPAIRLRCSNKYHLVSMPCGFILHGYQPFGSFYLPLIEVKLYPSTPLSTWGRRGIAPLILNVDIGWRWVVSFTPRILCCLFLARHPPLGQGFLIHEVSRSHSTTHHSR